jgi:hypothetical protein
MCENKNNLNACSACCGLEEEFLFYPEELLQSWSTSQQLLETDKYLHQLFIYAKCCYEILIQQHILRHGITNVFQFIVIPMQNFKY